LTDDRDGYRYIKILSMIRIKRVHERYLYK